MASISSGRTRLEQKRQFRSLNYKAKIDAVEVRIQKANTRLFLRHKIGQAIDILETANKLFNGNLAIAFSGGKDSLAALHLTLQLNSNLPVIFNNTTVEFPETLMFARNLTKEWHLNMCTTVPRQSFFHAVKEKGWAGHEDRWCCRPYKDEPAFKFLVGRDIGAEITGTTRTESIYRRSLTPFRMPKKEPYIIRINPIYDWNEWEVWAYIRKNRLPYNPLYDLGYRRIGCWCCPLNGRTHYQRLRKTHPRMYDFLRKFVPKHPAFRRSLVHKSKSEKSTSERIIRKEPCKTEVDGRLVKTCDLFGHFFKNGFCFRCGKPAPS